MQSGFQTRFTRRIYIEKKKDDRALRPNNTIRHNIPVAVIGMGCFFPKASGLKEYWRLLFRGEDAVAEVPASHWSPEDYFDTDPKKPDHVYCKRGGFLSPVSFDPSEFGIPPSSLEATDTSQLLGLLAAKTALEDAGYGEKREVDRDKTSVILGVTGAQELVIPLGARLGHPIWRRALRDAGVNPEQAQDVIARIGDSYVSWQENSFPGLLGNVIAGRICNRLDMGGTNCAVDAACASSMSALHLALMELATGRSDMAVTGGVDTFNDIFMHTCFSKTLILSPTGDARPFSKDADGTVLGEGIGMLVLKRLEDAERDNDRIYAVIKAVGSSSDGKSQSIYAPRAEGQAKALRMAYQISDTDPRTVEMIEAHGTGTKVGDMVEFQALKTVFSESSSLTPNPAPRTPHCALGSVKSMIGHTKAAAGSAGLIKAVLAVRHKVFLPTLKITEPDPNLKIEESPFYLNTESRPWFSRPEHPRRCGVSALGFGGSNFHAVVEEYQKEKKETAYDGSVFLPESVRQPKSLEKTGKIAFIFPGQGSQYVNMGRDMICTFPEAFEVAEKANRSKFRIQNSKFETARLSDFIYPYPVQTKEDKQIQEESLRSTDIAQPAIGVISLAMLKILERFGIKADAAAGHSFGELTALHAAGWIDSETFFRLAVARGSFMAAAAGPDSGTMLAVKAPLDALDCLIKEENLDVVLANRNSPEQGVLSGTTEAILLAEKLCKAKKFKAVKLPVAAAFHSRLVKNAQEPFMELLKQVRITPSDIPVYANTTGQAYPSDADGARQLLGEQILCPVNFVGEIEAMFEAGIRTFIEIGPKSVLTGLVKAILKGREFNALSVDTSSGKKSGTADLADMLSQLSALGYTVNADQWDQPAEPKKQRMSIPISGANYRSESKPEKPGPQGSNGGSPNNSLPPVSGSNSPNSDQAETNSASSDAGWVKPISNAGQVKPASSDAVKKAVQPLAPSRKQEVKSNAITPSQGTESRIPAFRQYSKNMDRKERNPIPDSRRQAPDNNRGHKLVFVSEAFRAVQEGLKSMQSLQMQTAETHKKFLETQTEAGRTLRMMMESTQRLAEVSMGVQPRRGETHLYSEFQGEGRSDQPCIEEVVPPIRKAEIPAEKHSVPVPSRSEKPASAVPHSREEVRPSNNGQKKIETVLLEVVSHLTGYPVEMLAPDMDIESDLGIDSIKRVEILSTLEERMPGLPRVSPEIMGTLRTLSQIVAYLSNGKRSDSEMPQCFEPEPLLSEGNRKEIETTLLEVVSHLTGYPTEMLAPDMDIESDLGIDSIKRVEILSTLEERMPGLPGVSPEIMGTLRTLGQIVAYLSDGKKSEAATSECSKPDMLSCGGNRKEVETTLLEVVSHLTGYPAEMLGSDMDIESDLGIDSIKRVEILSTLEERMPGLPAVSPEVMGTLRTLGQIRDYLAGKDKPGIETESDRFQPSCIRTEADGGFHPPYRKTERRIVKIVSGVHTPYKGKGVLFPAGRKVLVTDDGSGLGKAIVSELNAINTEALLIASDSFRHEKSLPSAAGLILVMNPEMGKAYSEDNFLKDAFMLTRHVARDILESAGQCGAIFASVSRIDGAFGFKGKDVTNPLQGGLAGLVKTAAVEWENVCCHAIDVSSDWKDNAAMAKAIVAECLTSGEVEVGLEPEIRNTFRLGSEPYPQGKINLDAGDVVVISGGARGVTAAAAQALASHVKATFVLIGRSPEPYREPEWLAGIEDDAAIKKAVLANQFSGNHVSPMELEKAFKAYKANREINKTLEQLKSAGAKAVYFSADVRDAGRVNAIMGKIRSEYGPAAAVIHAAGTLEDRLIVDKTPEQFDKVFDTKVRGLNVLLNAVQSDAVKYIVLFSSVSARLGNKGQADYAMANEVLNKIAQREAAARKDCRVISVNWGPWDGGMVSPALKREFERRGVGLIPLEEGARAMIAEMMGDKSCPAEVVIGADIVPETVAENKSESKLSLTFKREIDVDRYPILGSHILDGKPVVPFALITEWLGHGALHENPGLFLHGLDDIRLLSGIRLSEEKKLIRLMAGKARKNGSVFEVDVEIRDGIKEGKEVIHSRAKAILANTLSQPPAFNISADISSKAYSRSIDEVYEKILFHGIELRGIREILSASSRGMVARVASAPSPEKWMSEPLRSRWIGDPLVLDSAFQMAIIWCFEETGMVSLPSYSASYRQYRHRFPAEGVTAVLEVKNVSDHKLMGDFTFLDADNTVVARLSGYEAIMAPSLFKAFK